MRHNPLGFFGKFNKGSASINNVAQVLCHIIMTESATQAEAFITFLDDDNKNEFNNDYENQLAIALQFTFLYNHVIDRISHNFLDDSMRSQLMNNIVKCIADNLVSLMNKTHTVPDTKKLWYTIIDGLNFMGEQYGQCKGLFNKDGDSLKNTVLWEFGKNIAELFRHPMDIKYITKAIDLSTQFFEKYDINQIINQLV
jgi:hypothetical protein